MLSAPGNSTCLPTIAVFTYYSDERMNYTLAEETCDSQKARLADVLSGMRTNYLASLVYQHQIDVNKQSILVPTSDSNEYPRSNADTKIAIRHAYVGLTEAIRSGKFYDSRKIPIECYLYRAWEPKYPRLTFTHSWLAL